MKTASKVFLVSGTAVTVAAVAGVSHGITKTMMRVALDRNIPGIFKNSERAQKQLLGSKGNAEIENKIRGCSEILRALPHETVEIRARDGERLVGHWFACNGAKRTVIAMHGWRSSWAFDFGAMHEFFRSNQCNVLYPEQRAHGNSGGEYLGFGLLERYDCRQWIDWVNRTVVKAVPIYLQGISMGASTVLMTADLDLPENVRGIVADCGFTSPQAIWMHVAGNNLGLSTGIRAKVADGICRKKLKMSGSSHSAVKSMSSCKVPVLFIHGADDHFVPVQMTYENYLACAAPKRLLIVPGADHGLSYYAERERYEEEVTRFWKENDKA